MTSAIIVAAGKSLRMGANVDKLFFEVAGKPVVVHTWQRFAEAEVIDELILVVREGLQDGFRELATKFKLPSNYQLVAGGEKRQDSVWNGLQAVAGNTDVVAIQDAARPCTGQEVIAKTIIAAREHGAAVAAQRVVDTIKESTDGETVSRTLDRDRLWAVQTPQCFRVEILRKALTEVRSRGVIVTDDTAACDLIGQKVHLVPSSEPNPKITRPEDVAYLEVLLRRNKG
jgi:2-C-methyl-D-erythritol 4-phosphate cytidylyltransferase